MITNEAQERVRGWFAGRLPEEWQAEPPRITVDREEITVVLTIPDVDARRATPVRGRARPRPGPAGPGRSARRPASSAWRSPARPSTASSARSRGACASATTTELWTHVAAPVMTRLRQPQRLVLDTLVDAGVARSRSDALAWCVRLVGQHEDDWLGRAARGDEHRSTDVREQGPAAA